MSIIIYVTSTMWYDEQELRDTIKEERRGFSEWYNRFIEPQIQEQQSSRKRKRRHRRTPKEQP